MKVSSIIKNPVARKVVSSAMLVGATLGVTTNVLANNNKIQTQNVVRSEFVNKDATRVLRANALYSSLELEDKVLIIDNADNLNYFCNELSIAWFRFFNVLSYVDVCWEREDLWVGFSRGGTVLASVYWRYQDAGYL